MNEFEPSDIGKCCRRKRKSAGKHPETEEKLRWMYYEDWEQLTEEEKQNELNKV